MKYKHSSKMNYKPIKPNSLQYCTTCTSRTSLIYLFIKRKPFIQFSFNSYTNKCLILRI